MRGEAVVELRTDRPGQRFAPGQVLLAEPGRVLTIVSSRPHQRRWLVTFEGIRDRDGIEALRGVDLEVEMDSEPADDDPDVFADADLVGLDALDADGLALGVVRAVEHLPMHDLLVVVTPDGRAVHVPFVSAIVPDVDLARRRLWLDPPVGLFDAEDAS